MHAPLAFSVEDDCLVVGGEKVTSLAARVGTTPFFAYDGAAIEQRVATLRATVPPGVGVHYALKANPMPALARHMVGLVDGLDVASAGEIELALAAGEVPARMSFAGPGKRAAELERAVALGVAINVESERELESVAALGGGSAPRPRVALRVNPAFEIRSSGMRMGGGPSPFGIDAERALDVLGRVRELPVTFEGLHVFAGSQCLDPEALARMHAHALDLTASLARDAAIPVPSLVLGAGFGIPYFPGDTRLDPEQATRGLHDGIDRFRDACPETRVALELGRYLVGEAGVYVCRIVDRKVSRGETFLVTDGGLHHHLAASGNFGQVLRKNYPVVVADKVAGGPREVATVVGPLCTPLDLLGARVELGRADIGDLVVVLQSGAYALSASPIRFLAHPEPREILI